MKLEFPLRSLRLAVMALAVPLVAGCGDKTEDPPDTTDPTTPLYAITTQILTTDDPQSYVLLTDSVDQSQALSLDNAIELPGRALGVGIPKSGALFVAGDEDAVVTRYNVTSEGRLEKGATVNFEGKGVDSISEYQHQFQFISDTKAYYFDGRTSQVIIWNPSDMSITGTIALSGLTVEGAAMTFATLPVRREKQVIMAVGWRPAAGVGITKQAGVIVVDTEHDTAKVVVDDRCGYVRDGVEGPDGMIYLATEVYGASVRRVAGGDTPVPCLLRFNPQTLEFDKSFHKELSSFANGGTVGSLIPGPTGTAYLRVFDEGRFTVAANTHPRALASAPAWQWWQLKLDTLVATPVTALPASTGSTFLYKAENRTLFTEFASGSTATSFRELTDQSGKVASSLPGLAFSFVQVR